MPTILRFRGFNILIFVDDHGPAHVHVLGKGVRLTYLLHCPRGSVSLRDDKGTVKLKVSDERALEAFLNENVELLCEAWRSIHER